MDLGWLEQHKGHNTGKDPNSNCVHGTVSRFGPVSTYIRVRQDTSSVHMDLSLYGGPHMEIRRKFDYFAIQNHVDHWYLQNHFHSTSVSL